MTTVISTAYFHRSNNFRFYETEHISQEKARLQPHGHDEVIFMKPHFLSDFGFKLRSSGLRSALSRAARRVCLFIGVVVLAQIGTASDAQSITAASYQITGIGDSASGGTVPETANATASYNWNGGGPYTDEENAITTGSGCSSFFGISANPASPLVAAVAQSNCPTGALEVPSAFVYLTYDLEITGPSATNIPFTITGELYAGYTPNADGWYESGSYQMNAVFRVYDYTQGVYLVNSAAISDINPGDTDPSDIMIDSTGDVNSGDLLEVYEAAACQPTYDSAAESFVRNTSFQIDQTFPSATDYSVDTSPGIGNPLPVPEPKPLTLLSIPLAALIGLRARLSRRNRVDREPEGVR